MAALQLARRRALIGCAAAAALILPGCSAAGQSPSITGHQLTIYVSDPTSVAGDQASQDVIRAEQLAFSQLKGKVSAFQVSLRVLGHANIAENARQAIEDTNAIAYLGDVSPGSSADSVGITNAQDILQVSPTDTAAALTRQSPAVPGSPSHYYESFSTYGQTFARVVPSSQHEATALLAEMRAAGVKTLHVQSDGGDYGRVLGAEITAGESGQGISPAASPAGAGAVLYAGSSHSAGVSALNAAASANPAVKLFASSALADPGLAGSLTQSAQRRLSLIVPGAPRTAPAVRKFATDFRSAYGHAPGPEAIFGYAAMQTVLDALHVAGSKANDRATVVRAVTKHSFTATVLGSFSIDRYGDSSLGSFVMARFKAGKLVLGKALQG